MTWVGMLNLTITGDMTCEEVLRACFGVLDIEAVDHREGGDSHRPRPPLDVPQGGTPNDGGAKCDEQR